MSRGQRELRRKCSVETSGNKSYSSFLKMAVLQCYADKFYFMGIIKSCTIKKQIRRRKVKTHVSQACISIQRIYEKYLKIGIQQHSSHWFSTCRLQPFGGGCQTTLSQGSQIRYPKYSKFTLLFIAVAKLQF